MKKTLRFMLVSLILAITMSVPIQSLAALVSSNGNWVNIYESMDAEKPLPSKPRVQPQEADYISGGWYLVNTIEGKVYVRASELTVLNGETPPQEPAAPPVTAQAQGANANSAASSLPDTVSGVKDATYTGTVIQFTVPAGGLWLYNAVGGSPVENAKAGTSLRLTQEPAPDDGWFSLYYNSKTYYVPQSGLSTTPNAGATLSPMELSGIRSVLITSDTFLSTGYKITYNLTGRKYELELTGTTSNELKAGIRVNVRYVSSNNVSVCSYDLGGKTYYFDPSHAGSPSTAAVVSNEDVSFMSLITPVAGAKLFFTMNKATNYVESDGKSLYGVKVNADWYKVQYGADVMYLLAEDVSGDPKQIAENNVSLGTFYVTAGSGGAKIYAGMAMKNGVPDSAVVGTIPAGQRVLASQYSNTWFTYMEDTAKRYLYYTDMADYISASNVTGLKIYVDGSSYLYSKPSESYKTSIQLAADYYTVQNYNDEWYSIVYGNASYYIKKASTPASAWSVTVSADGVTAWRNVPGGESIIIPVGTSIRVTPAKVNNHNTTYPVSAYYATVLDGVEYLIDKTLLDRADGKPDGVEISREPIANTATGKTYTVTIGVEGALLFMDASCGGTAAGRLMPGEVVKAERHTASLYIVNNAGNKLYLPVKYIASVKGGDDVYSTENNPDEMTGGSISDIVKGEKNTEFRPTVVSYRIPAGGLWLYYEKNVAKGGKILNAGTTISLCGFIEGGVENAEWYTTWYGGVQYYVLKSSLLVRESDVTTTTGYAILLKKGVDLYTTTTFTGTLARKAGITLAAGTRINVTVGAKNINGGVAYYRYVHFNGTAYYFPGTDVTDEISAATLSSNADTNLITKVTLKGDKRLYSSPDIRSSHIVSEENTLYGVKYDNTWYKVIYHNTSWYVRQADVDVVEQMTISDGVASTTYTVTIIAGGVDLYEKPETNLIRTTVGGRVYEAGKLNISPYRLAGGAVVAASRYNASWFTLAHESGKILYFQNSAVANTSSNEAISSYQIKLESGQSLSLYKSVSENAAPTLERKLEGPAVFTLRRVNSKWSSIVVGGITYYVKNFDIDENVMKESTPIASTSVGNTYTITIGGKAVSTENIPVYRSSSLTGALVGNIAAGTRTSGTLMYVKEAERNTSNKLGLVYAIKLNGVTGYIDAAYVSGVLTGDEANELKEAQQQSGGSGGSGTAVGTTIMKTLDAGTVVYPSMNTGSQGLTISSTMTKELTKVNDSWYSLAFGETTYYIPAAAVERGSNAGSSLAVGESITYTFTQGTPLYNMPESYAPIADSVLAGETLTLYKINDRWYEVTYEEKRMYVKVSDVMLPMYNYQSTAPIVNQGGQTTDGTGIITEYVLIDPVSGTVNLRKTAATNATILERIPKGTQAKNGGYTVDANGKIWYKVTYNGTTGYVLGDYIKAVGVVSDSSTPVVSASDPIRDIGKTLTVNTNSVNIRKGAGSEYAIIGKLDKGAAIVPVSYSLGDKDGMVWYCFQYNSSTKGYIRADYLTGTSTINEMSGNVAIRAGETNLRSGAGESFSLITKLARDTIVTIIGTGTDSAGNVWYRVRVDNLSGYVRSDLVRPLSTAEANALLAAVASQYKQLSNGDKGEDVRKLQQQLIALGYLAAGQADGIYGAKTTAAVRAFQSSKGITANGIATPQTQALLFNTTSVPSGSTKTLDWFAEGFKLINANKNITIYDINTGVTWSARYINGDNHADVIPASKADADKLKANNITGSYIRRPVIVTIAGQKYAGSMYAVGHGTTNYCDYFSGVVCIHFTGSKTHGTGNVDTDHQAAINAALQYGN
ncbi:MAG: SH3 domain-containing protein [Firmicutes bacterium]|nr:SH3 domain-containing protein [Bacillota bacterium]